MLKKVYDKWVTNFNAIDTKELFLKTLLTLINQVEKKKKWCLQKILETSGLVKEPVLMERSLKWKGKYLIIVD